MNYTIITDEPLLRDFIDTVLPDLLPNEQFYCCLFARKKYCPEGGVKHVKSDKSQLKRFTSTKDRLLSKIRQLECPLGSYVQENNQGQVVPQEALAFYITPNPRDLWKATTGALVKLAHMIQHANKNANPHSEVMSEIQRTPSRKVWTTFDVDSKDESVIATVNAAVGEEARLILETRGGYHIMVDAPKVPKHLHTTWHRTLSAISDIKGDKMIPVPGTYQGGFTPHFVP